MTSGLSAYSHPKPPSLTSTNVNADAVKNVEIEVAPSKTQFEASIKEQVGEGNGETKEDEGVSWAMPVLGTVVDSPTAKQLEQAKESLHMVPLEQASAKANYGSGEEISQEAREIFTTASELELGGDAKRESIAFRKAYESNQWPHQRDKEAGHPDSDYYDSTGADQRPSLSSLTPLQRVGGVRYYDKETAGAAGAVQIEEEEEGQIRTGIKRLGLRPINATRKMTACTRPCWPSLSGSP